MSLRKIINKLKKKSLSGDDVLKLLNNKAKLIIYSDLENFKHIDDALENNGNLIILYETKQSYGHWTCLFRNELKPNVISFFDPYGLKPDDELRFVPKHFKKISGQNYPLLSALLIESGYKIEYNEYKLQQSLEDINTCGRHCVVRILMKVLSLEDYVKLLKSFKKYSPDDIVTFITADC